MLAHPDIGEAEFLRLHRGAADRVGASLAADMGQMDADLHDRGLLPIAGANVARHGGGVQGREGS